MQSKDKITRTNAMDIIKRFAKEYRKALGKAPAEIIIVGGGSIMLNYKFRDATQDFDVILRAASGIKDVILKPPTINCIIKPLIPKHRNSFEISVQRVSRN